MDAVLDEGPIKIDGQSPVQFVAPIAGAPAYGRIEAQVAGLAPGEEPWLGVNGQALMGVAVEIPGLEDPGFRQGALGQSLHYGGWRKVVAYVPVGLLRKGENQVDWKMVGEGSITVRNIRLQVVFGEVSQELTSRPAAPSPQPVVTQVTMPKFEPMIEKRAQVQLRTGLSSSSGVVGLRQNETEIIQSASSSSQRWIYLNRNYVGGGNHHRTDGVGYLYADGQFGVREGAAGSRGPAGDHYSGPNV